MIGCCFALCPRLKYLTPSHARPRFIQIHFPNLFAKGGAFPSLIHSVVPPHAPELNPHIQWHRKELPIGKANTLLPAIESVRCCQGNRPGRVWPGVIIVQYMEKCVSCLEVEVAPSVLDVAVNVVYLCEILVSIPASERPVWGKPSWMWIVEKKKLL